MKGFELFLQRVLFVLLENEHQGDALVPLPDNRGVEFPKSSKVSSTVSSPSDSISASREAPPAEMSLVVPALGV